MDELLMSDEDRAKDNQSSHTYDCDATFPLYRSLIPIINSLSFPYDFHPGVSTSAKRENNDLTAASGQQICHSIVQLTSHQFIPQISHLPAGLVLSDTLS
jgi:hypothetical protein